MDYNYRKLQNGSVSYRHGSGYIRTTNAINSAFYKLGAGNNWHEDYYQLVGNFDGCIFVDSAVVGMNDTGFYHYYNANFRNCVFYGNSSMAGTNESQVTSLKATAYWNNADFNIANTYYDAEHGKMYLTRNCSGYLSRVLEHDFMTAMSKYKITKAKINSEEDLEFLFDTLGQESYNGCYYGILDENGQEIRIDAKERKIYEGEYDDYVYGGCYCLYQIEAPFLKDVTNIKLDKYLVDIDLEESYQIDAKITPTNVSGNELIYESENEEVLTVDSDGLVIPKKFGSAVVKIYSADRALSTYLTINVRSVTLPEKIELSPKEITLQIGATQETKVCITPKHATRYALSYESSDPEIASIDEVGVVTAHATGDVQITAIGYGGIKDTITVHCVLPAVGKSRRT